MRRNLKRILRGENTNKKQESVGGANDIQLVTVIYLARRTQKAGQYHGGVDSWQWLSIAL